MEERRKLQKNSPEYKQLNKEIRRKCKEEKEKSLEKEFEDIEDLCKKDQQMMYKKVRKVTFKNKRACTGRIKEDETIATDQDQIRRRWTEYIRELYADDTKEEKLVIRKDMNSRKIDEGEIKIAISKMKRGKAVGNDQIAYEMIEALAEFGVSKITEIANYIYDSEESPRQMLESVFTPLPKKPGTTECKEHRTISLMSHVSKRVLRVLLNRMKQKLKSKLSDEQFGYQPGKRTRNAIFCLRMLAEKAIEKRKDLYIRFIDYVKAFDRVKHKKLMEMLEHLEVDGKDLRLLANLYWNQRAAIKTDRELGGWIEIGKGVRQGCVLSPDLFNLHGEHAYSGIQSDEGIELRNRWYNNLRSEDDAALFADNEERLQRIVDSVNEESERIGLAINCKKTFSMVISKNEECPKSRITVNGEEIVQMDSFRYLGCCVTSVGKSDAEIKRRIGQAKTIFMQMRRVLSASTISIEIRKRLIKCYVWSVLTYGSEAWIMSKAMEKRLQVMEMWCWRKMMKNSWTKKMKNEEVLDRVKAKRKLLKNIRNRQ